tara:strand:+ start:145 stop:267 length:123 start_codon:yes stop_codon:yes gene_type:complete
MKEATEPRGLRNAEGSEDERRILMSNSQEQQSVELTWDRF